MLVPLWRGGRVWLSEMRHHKDGVAAIEIWGWGVGALPHHFRGNGGFQGQHEMLPLHIERQKKGKRVRSVNDVGVLTIWKNSN